MKVGEAVAEIMKREGIEILCGYPVNHLLEYAAAADIRPIIVRQERIGLHMADAISRVTSGRKIGAFCMQHGPGSENAYGGVAQAYSESVPLLVIPQGYPRRIAGIDPNFSAVTRDARRGEDRRARDRAGRDRQRHAPRLQQPAQRPQRPGDRRNPHRHLERGNRRSRLHAGQPRALCGPIRPTCARRRRRSWRRSAR